MQKALISKEEAMNFIVNLNRTLFLDNKEHIKRYYKAREIHASVLDSMINYIDSGKLPIEDYYNIITDDLKKETNNLCFLLDNREQNDFAIFNELFIYKNHDKIPSLTEIFIEKNKFKNIEKNKMLYSMRNSIVSLFQIIDTNHNDGYVTYQDVFTQKKYKIVDISMSSLGEIYKDSKMYIYNRIINYDGLLFGTGIPCVFSSKNKRLQRFLKTHKYKKCSNFSRCLMLYDIYKNSDNKISMNNYHEYK